MGTKTKISLDRFAEIKEVIVPVANGYGTYNRRYFRWSNETGYYLAFVGDDIRKVGPANLIEVWQMLQKLPSVKGISYGDLIIPLNFDEARFKGFQETIPVKFMQAELGVVVDTRQWEDGTLLYEGLNAEPKKQLLVSQVKKAAENGELLTLKGVTPEMRYFYLMVVLDKQRFEEWQNLDSLNLPEEEKQKRIRQFEESFAGRLQRAIESAGGKLVKFNKRGNRVDVTWKIGRQTMHSIINQDFKVLELGFCASGHDKDHSIASAVLLAEQYISEGLLHVTRE